jgi:hypothetical protein
LVSESALVDDPVRVTVAGVEVEGRIKAVESSTLRVRFTVLRQVLRNRGYDPFACLSTPYETAPLQTSADKAVGRLQ